MNRFFLDISNFDQFVASTHFSGVINISYHGASTFQKAYGYADRARRYCNKCNTRFGIASGTKFLTALGIGKLIDSGDLSLSTKALDIIPYHFPTYHQNITIDQLLNHTSGIPDYYDEELVANFDQFQVAIPWTELEEPIQYFEVFPQTPMKFMPGARFSYCNSGYIMLAAIIAQLSATKYTKFIEREIFLKQGMLDSGFYPLNHLPANTALGYIDSNDNWRTNVYDLPIVGGGDGGAFTTLTDLDLLWDAFFARDVLSAELTEHILNNQVLVKENQSYSYGMWIDEYNGYTIRSMEGCDAGVSFQSASILDDSLRYTVISNTTNGVWPITRKIKELLLSEPPKRPKNYQ